LTQEDDDIRLALGMLLKSCQQERDSTRGCQPAATSTIGANPEWFMTSLRDLRQTMPLTTRESTHSALCSHKKQTLWKHLASDGSLRYTGVPCLPATSWPRVSRG
jgi:hypothetical protein